MDKILPENQEELTKRERKILEYFWNEKRQELRDEIPREVVFFLECEARPEAKAEDGVTVDLVSMFQKGYIVDSSGPLGNKFQQSPTLELTKKGSRYVSRAHPSTFIYWERALQLMPSSVTLASTIVGIVGTALAIIQAL